MHLNVLGLCISINIDSLTVKGTNRRLFTISFLHIGNVDFNRSAYRSFYIQAIEGCLLTYFKSIAIKQRPVNFTFQPFAIDIGARKICPTFFIKFYGFFVANLHIQIMSPHALHTNRIDGE